MCEWVLTLFYERFFAQREHTHYCGSCLDVLSPEVQSTCYWGVCTEGYEVNLIELFVGTVLPELYMNLIHSFNYFFKTGSFTLRNCDNINLLFEIFSNVRI